MDATARKFIRAAEQRLESARLLHDHGRNLDAVYLAGYRVECALKSVLIMWTPRNDRERIIAEMFRGRAGHDLPVLRDRLRDAHCIMPSGVATGFRRVVTWETDLRYEPGLIPSVDATAFLEAASVILQWARRSAGNA